MSEGRRMKNIEAKITVLFFEEGDKVIAYSPAFDLSSCGDTEGIARDRFAEAVAIFLSEINKMGTLNEVMEECGWHRVPEKQGWYPPIYKTREEAISIPLGV